MARKHHRRRDTRPISNHHARFDDRRLADRWLPSPLINEPEVRSTLLEVEDLRTWHPDRHVRAFRSPRRARVQVGIPSTAKRRRGKSWAPRLPSFFYPSIRLGFKLPRFVAVCVRRKERREIMHAKGFAGSRVSKPRRSTHSFIRC